MSDSRAQLHDLKKKLGESETCYRIVTETVTDAIIIIDQAGQLTFVNPAAETIFGYTAAEMLNHPLTMLIPEHIERRRQPVLQKYSDAQQPIVQGWVGLLGRHKNGRAIPLELSLGGFTKGDQLFLTGVIHDVTKRTQTEQALQDRIYELKMAYDQAKIYAQELNREIVERRQAEQQIRQFNEELEQRVADRTRDLSLLYEVTLVASESLALDTMLKHSLERVLAAINRTLGVIHLLDDPQKRPQLAVQQGLPADLAAASDSMPLIDETIAWMVEYGEPVLIPDITTDTRILPIANVMGAYTYLGVPMRARRRVLGVLSIFSDQAHQFNAEEVALLASVADQVGVMVENARLRQQAEHAAVIEERERLARELHDSVTQSLYSLTLFAEAGENLLETGDLAAVKHNLARMGETAQQALKEMRLLVYELRPLDLEHEGLIGALHQRLSAVESRVNIRARLVAETLIELPAPVEEELYRIAQEALNNALKHAAASSVTIYLRTEGDVVELEVVDDGQGFNPNQVGQTGGMGLDTMQQRVEKLGGSLDILSTPTEGTKVKVRANIKVKS